MTPFRGSPACGAGATADGRRGILRAQALSLAGDGPGGSVPPLGRNGPGGLARAVVIAGSALGVSAAMNTREEIEEAFADFQAGRMGKIAATRGNR